MTKIMFLFLKKCCLCSFTIK